jgi:hypothetical protein
MTRDVDLEFQLENRDGDFSPYCFPLTMAGVSWMERNVPLRELSTPWMRGIICGDGGRSGLEQYRFMVAKAKADGLQVFETNPEG